MDFKDNLNMSAIILAGGKARRFNGENKAFLKIGNKTIIEKIISKLVDNFEELIVVTNNFDLFGYPVKMVRDIEFNNCSLVGLYSGLMRSNTKYNFVMACDMPFINMDLIRYMQSICRGYDVVVPKIDLKYQTLHAIYSLDIIWLIKKQLESGDLKINSIFKNVKIREMSEQEIKKFDKDLISFTNINTPKDYDFAKSIAFNINI